MNALDPIRKFSLVIPAHNEAEALPPTILAILKEFEGRKVELEILVVNDNSSDGTEKVLQELSTRHSQVRYINNHPPHGFGQAVRRGLENYSGDAVAIVMADGSDLPHDILVYYHRLDEGVHCAFGSRFMPGAKIVDYPALKLFLNRMANLFIRLLFGFRYNDVTNAFKAYRREVIDGCQPLLSNHFNLTVEIPLKAIVRGYTYTIVPTGWINRKTGESKLKIKEMGSRYLFIVLYVLLEKWLSKGDYRVRDVSSK
jgi:dolichol-phosphate mannosyltransferase